MQSIATDDWRNPMELRQLRTFRVVAENLSFTKTADQLHMAQSSVSAQIRALEEELEVKLFDRIGRRVLLTDAGRKLYQYARRIESMTEEISSEITGIPHAGGHLTVRVPETLASVYLPKITKRFHRQYPQVRLDFINCSDQMLREELNSGRIDLAFLMIDTLNFKEVNVRMLKVEELILVAGSKHPFCLREKITLKDLHEQTVLMAKTD
jgi:DNA-binding transcriptional LysR family regulator